MPSASPSRLIAAAVITAAVVAAVGFAWETARFGFGNRNATERLDREVRERFAARAEHVRTLAEQVARDAMLVEEAADARERVATLFARLADLARSAGTADPISATVYVPAGPPSQYRILAWSDGPAEDLTPDRLSGSAALFVAPGTLGLRLVFVQPIEIRGRRVGVASVETILSPVARVGSTTGPFYLHTSFGPVTVRPRFAGAGESPRHPDVILITIRADNGAPLLDATFASEDLRPEQLEVTRRVLAASAVPLVIAMLLLTGRVTDRRTASTSVRGFFGWSAVAAAIVTAAAAALAWLSDVAGLPAVADEAIFGLWALTIAGLFPISWWWRRGSRLQADRAVVHFVFEQLVAGVALAGILIAMTRILSARINPSSLEEWQFPLFPIEPAGLASLCGLLVLQLALAWAAASVVATMAPRWRVGWRRPALTLVAMILWTSPTFAFIWTQHGRHPLLRFGLASMAVACALFASGATGIRHYYRHTTHAMRLALLFAALLAPVIVLYPIAWSYADQTARGLIEHEYSPATTGHPRDLLNELERAEAEIDAMPPDELRELISADRSNARTTSPQAAFHVWTLTSLARTRATSAIELYAANGGLASRFGLNVPEYSTASQARTLQRAECQWTSFNDVVRFGAEDRNVFHAERALCDDAGRSVGAIAVYLVSDYQALPFVPSPNPYYEVLQSPEAPPPRARIPDLQVVVYGWSFHPWFASGTVAWPVSPALAERLTASREPFWTTLESGSQNYKVFFSSDRSSIYALGYIAPTLFEHLTRLSEAAALCGILFVVFLAGSALYAPFAQHRHVALRGLFHEIRTSFYRKLFLFFVLAAIGPVLMLAVAFGTYMTDRFRADVAKEAASVVTVARRVFEEMAAVQQHPDQPQMTVTDDVMVWIGQVIDQNVNLFEGAQLAATSQRDLFDSGILPKRTPSGAFRDIALNRVATYVGPDQLGDFRYLVAAAPVTARGPDAMLTVPLSLRQRDIDKEIDQLTRGVLVGSVFVVLFAAGLGASVARRVSDPVARLTRATQQIAAGKLDVRIVADTADELRRLVDDFNSMAATLSAQRGELARTNQLKAWAEMARQVAHEIKNPLTPIQLAAEHLQRVHEDRHRPLGSVFDQCVSTVLAQVRLLRQIASEFSNFAGTPTPRFEPMAPRDLVNAVLDPYKAGLSRQIATIVDVPEDLPQVRVDRTLVGRALTNVVENAFQAIDAAGPAAPGREHTLKLTARATATDVVITVTDTGAGMNADALLHAFEPYFSTRTAGSGLGLANARRNVELCGGSMSIASVPSQGTTVTTTLPRAARTAASSSS